MLIHVGMRPSMSKQLIGSLIHERMRPKKQDGASRDGRKKVRRERVNEPVSSMSGTRENSEWINGRGQAHGVQQMAMQEGMLRNGPVVTILNSRTRKQYNSSFILLKSY